MTPEAKAADTGRDYMGVVLYPFDLIVIGYCLVMVAVIAALGRPFGEYLDELAFYAGAGAAAALIAGRLPESRHGWRSFVRLMYPALVFGLFYRMTGGLMTLVHPSFLDYRVVAFEKALFGGDPSLAFDRGWLHPLVNDLLALCYGSYYLIIPVFLLTVYFLRRGDIIKEYMAAVCLAFFASYFLFFLLPVEGPRWHFAAEYVNSVEGSVFTPIVKYIIAHGAVRGGAMPSSHTAVALVSLLFCYRYFRRAAIVLTPVVLGLAAGAVWGRFHYVSDVLVGAVIGIAAYALVMRWLPARPAAAPTPIETPSMVSRDVP